MQREQQISPQKPTLPLTDQLGGGYMHTAPIAPFFGGTVFPPVEKHLMPFHGVSFQPSEACPRNFIICDQTDKRSQIMFHPAISPKLCYPGLNAGFPSFQNGAKRNAVNSEREISSFKEDSDDIDALLSFEEDEEEECDDDEVSSARTHGNYGSDSPDSCSTNGSRTRKCKLPSFSQELTDSDNNCSGRKRQKMRKMVKTLRRIVPGGNRMNTVAVLDEAVRYLKSLKVEVQKLGVGNLKS